MDIQRLRRDLTSQPGLTGLQMCWSPGFTLAMSSLIPLIGCSDIQRASRTQQPLIIAAVTQRDRQRLPTLQFTLVIQLMGINLQRFQRPSRSFVAQTPPCQSYRGALDLTSLPQFLSLQRDLPGRHQCLVIYVEGTCIDRVALQRAFPGNQLITRLHAQSPTAGDLAPIKSHCSGRQCDVLLCGDFSILSRQLTSCLQMCRPTSLDGAH